MHQRISIGEAHHRLTKAAAALRGQTIREYIEQAVIAQLERDGFSVPSEIQNSTELDYSLTGIPASP